MGNFAKSVHATTEDGFWQLAFADDPIQTQHYLVLQRAFEFDEQDKKLGMDTYYVELDDHSCSAYGGIRSAALSRRQIVLRFESDAAAQLNVEEVLEITFDLPQGDWQPVVDIARKILGNALVVHEG
jgi:hypothetical protein